MATLIIKTPQSTIWARKNKEKHRLNSKLWSLNNPEKIKEIQKKCYRSNLETNRTRKREFMRLNGKRWKKNQERSRIDSKAWYWRNPENARAIVKKWRDANKESVKIQTKKWRKLNPDKVKIHKQSYRIRRKQRAGHLATKIIQKVYEDNIKKYGTLTCVLCFKNCSIPDSSLEHLNPISRGGTHEYTNLGIAHRLCNSTKRNKTYEEWVSCK